MRKVRVWLPISCSVLLSACMFNSINGSGKIRTESRSVSGISAVDLSGSGQVIIEQTGSESLTVTTDDNLLPYIKTEGRRGRLDLGTRDRMTNLRPTENIIFKLTVKNLDKVGVSGSGTADLKGVTSNRLRIGISGSGQVGADGTADDLDVSISGSGNYQGAGMLSKRASVHVSGSGNAVIAASDTLRADVSGSGAVEYIGDPQVTKSVSGSGSVSKR